MTGSGIPVTSFTIAINRHYQSKSQEGGQQADFIDVTAWRGNAEFITRYFKRGSSICVTGSLQKRTWTDQQGNKRYSTEVIVDEVFFVDSKGGGSAAHRAVLYARRLWCPPPILEAPLPCLNLKKSRAMTTCRFEAKAP